MQESEQILVCHGCSESYPITDGIPQLFVPNDWGDGKLDVTDIVKDFYEETPFPDYDDVDSRAENFDQPPPPQGRQASEPRLNTRRSTTWFRDQYRQPHESKHSIDEVRVQTQSGRGACPAFHPSATSTSMKTNRFS